MCHNIDVKWLSSLDGISKEGWTYVFGNSTIKDFDFFKAMEKSCFEGVTNHILTVRVDGNIVAIFPCFVYVLDALDLMENNWHKVLLFKCRMVNPSFLKIRTFVIGTYVATVEDFCGIASDFLNETYDDIKQAIEKEIKSKAKETCCSIIFIKDIREKRIKDVKSIFPTFSYFSSFPSNIIPVCEVCKPYPMALKKKNRKRYKIFKQKFENGFKWSIITDFSKETGLMYQLYKNVLHVAKNKFETLNRDFFVNVNKFLAGKSFLLECTDDTDSVRVMELVIVEKDRLLPLYLGIKYEKDDTKVLYLNTIFETIRIAEQLNLSFVDLGQTSYYPKIMSGAIVENVYYGFFSNIRPFNCFIKYGFKYLFPRTNLQENVYMDIYKKDIINHFRKYGFNNLLNI